MVREKKSLADFFIRFLPLLLTRHAFFPWWLVHRHSLCAESQPSCLHCVSVLKGVVAGAKELGLRYNKHLFWASQEQMYPLKRSPSDRAVKLRLQSAFLFARFLRTAGLVACLLQAHVDHWQECSSHTPSSGVLCPSGICCLSGRFNTARPQSLRQLLERSMLACGAPTYLIIHVVNLQPRVRSPAWLTSTGVAQMGKTSTNVGSLGHPSWSQ